MSSSQTVELCPGRTVWRSSCKRRDCQVCGPRWARDQKQVLEENLGSVQGAVVMVSITAPGADVLPWDTEHCSHRKRHFVHYGPAGCRVQQRAAREWSEMASCNWSALRRAAEAWVRRSATRQPQKNVCHLVTSRVFVVDSAGEAELVPAVPRLLNRTWEPQKRGVAHLHVVLPYSTAVEKVAAHAFVGQLKRLAPEYKFGFVDARGKKKPKDDHRARSPICSIFGVEVRPVVGEHAARYLASYLSGRSKRKGSIRQNLTDPAMSFLQATRSVSETGKSALDESAPRKVVRFGLPLVWTSPRLTGVTYVTMRTLRRLRHLRASEQGRCELPHWSPKGPLQEAVKVVACYRRIHPQRAGPPGDIPAALEFARGLDADMPEPTLEWNGLLNQLPNSFADRNPDHWNRQIARTAFQITGLAAAA